MHSVELLIEALNKYEGSYILVSHDRYFVSKTANKIWEIVDEQIKEFKGTYTEYLEWKERMAKRAEAATPVTTTGKKTEPVKTAEQPLAAPAPAADTKQSINKEVKKEWQKQQRLLQQLEEQINTVTTEKNKLEQQLSDPATYSDKEKFLFTETSYKKLSQQVEQLHAQYETAFEKVMELESKLNT
jgi:ATP-binding cassette subfamily F protein 3